MRRRREGRGGRERWEVRRGEGERGGEGEREGGGEEGERGNKALVDRDNEYYIYISFNTRSTILS